MTAKFSPQAVQDPHDILEYIARDNPQAAVRVLDHLEASPKHRILVPAEMILRQAFARFRKAIMWSIFSSKPRRFFELCECCTGLARLARSISGPALDHHVPPR
jgi:plasmid stabilization system protein ParE